jgi:hypothetical protein
MTTSQASAATWARRNDSHSDLALIGRYSKLITFGLIVAVLSLSGCKQGYFSGQRFYFPAGSLPEDNWSAVVIVYFESPRRVVDTDEKRFSIWIKNKKGDSLYFESGKMRVGDVNATVQWQTVNSLKLVLKSEDGKVLLDRNLEFDSSKNTYTVKK